MILYTAAMSGEPMGAVLTHDNLVHNAVTVRERFNLDDHTVQLGALPLFHGFGQTAVQNASIAAAATVTLLPRFDPEHVLTMFGRDQVTMVLGVPTMFAALAFTAGSVEHDASTLRMCLSGGAHLAPMILDGFEAALGCELREGYGLTETSPVVTFNHPGQPRRKGTVGTAIDGVEVRLGDRSEVLVKGPNVMQGYYNQPAATAACIKDGWLATGDVGTLDDEGYLTLTGRTKEIIIRGGYNIYPAEVERVLREHPSIRDCRVVGLEHLALGEEVGAAVVLEDGERMTLAAVRGFARSEIATYKSPTHVWFVDELPASTADVIATRPSG